ncbi:MAG TPA: TIGR02466 family protein [Gammaproteobacteria bacterium]|nr:TIGR02466 family protein [Gammaproteobacteria bacterium]
MSVELFFSVPLLVEDIDTAARDAIHAKVTAYLKSERAKRDVGPAAEESVQTSYYKPEAQVLIDAELHELERHVLASAAKFLERLRLPPRRLEIERSWINVFEPGAQEAQHSHDGSLLSCSYYVEAPKDCGCIVMPDPIGARRSYREFTKTAGNDLLTRREIAVEPQPGRLVMFESWLPHYVQCNKSEHVRISIAMNLREAATQAPSPPARAATPAGGAAAAASASAPRARSADAEPFLFEQLFEVNPDLKLRLEPIQNAIPTIVIDDFLKHPEEAREVVGSAPAANWKHEKGGRNFIDYFDCRLRFPIRPPNAMIAAAQQVIRKVYALDTRPTEASVDVNWFRQIHEKRADFAVPHSDRTSAQRSLTCILYLNRHEECSGGTAFFRFKKSGSLVFDESYARQVQADARLAETGLDYWSGAADDWWELVGTVDMVPGRLLIFPSEYFHAAYHPQNSFYDFPRLTLAFWMVT